ncbi:MAG: succinate dehydrogenase cytochrome b subunit [Deltaproteobacteria bacterium]|nr:succinate dehydrogenase cytochrome b subunit [Deltaproteobacteria bacterium]
MNLVSIVKKALMALTGLAWIGFLVGHLSGNFLLLRGADAFNGYAAFLASLGSLLYVVEAALILFLLLHIYSGLRVTLENRRARPVRYAVAATAGRATVASRTMAAGGIIIAVFLVVHVKMFKFTSHQDVNNGLWGLVVDTFKEPAWVGAYIIAMLAVGMHVSHGLASAFQTLGLIKPRWRESFRRTGFAIGWLLAAGFITLPVWCYLVPTN